MTIASEVHHGGEKKARFNKAGIESLAQDKPVVYKIRNRVLFQYSIDRSCGSSVVMA